MSMQLQMSCKIAPLAVQKTLFQSVCIICIANTMIIFNRFVEVKRKYTNFNIYCQINVNICTIVFLMFTITIKWTIVRSSYIIYDFLHVMFLTFTKYATHFLGIIVIVSVSNGVPLANHYKQKNTDNMSFLCKMITKLKVNANLNLCKQTYHGPIIL